MRLPAFLALFLFLMGGCATTRLTSEWRDVSYREQPEKIMVIGIARKPVLRRVFEDEFVRRLKEAGTDAVASYTVLPGEKLAPQRDVAAKMKETESDAVLITRLVDRKVVRTHVPGRVEYPMGLWHDHYPAYYGTWHSYYGYGSRFVYTPGYVAEEEFALMETSLYNVTDGETLIWSASSETEIRGSDQKTIRSFIDVMVDKLRQQKLID